VKKVFSMVLGLILLFSLCLTIPIPVEASGDVWYVAPTGSDSGSGSESNPWATIRHAVSNASDGDTIRVAAGNYDEQITVTKSLTIQGAGDTTVVKPSQTTISGISTFYARYSGGSTDEAAVVIVSGVSASGNSVTLKDFEVDLSLVTALPAGAGALDNIFYSNSNGVIDNVTVTGLNESSLGEKNGGIRCVGYDGTAVQVEIENCSISEYNKNGITCNEPYLTANIHDNIITGLGSIDWSAQNGIQIAFGAGGIISNNTVSNNVYTGATYWATGVLVSESDSVTVSGNTLNHNNSAGIYIQKSSNCIISHNDITGESGDQAGIMVTNNNASGESASGNTISDNTVSGGWAGIWSSYCSGNTYSNNTISGCTGNGIYFWDTDGNTISGNTIYDVHDGYDTAWGIAFDGGDMTGSLGSDNNMVTGNKITRNDTGIWVGNSSDDTSIQENIIANNLYGVVTGKYAENGGSDVYPTGVTLLNNSLFNNTYYDVYNASTITINAESNWWELASGPYHSTQNPVGGGDAVSDYVDFCPWLLKPYSESNQTLMETWAMGQDTWTSTYTGISVTIDTTHTTGYSGIVVWGYLYNIPPDVGHALCVDAPGQRAFNYIDMSPQYSSGYIDITINYTDAELAAAGISDEDTLSLYYWDMGDSVWKEASDVTRDTAANWVKRSIPYDEFSGTPLCLGGAEDTTGHYTVGAEPDVAVIFTPSYMDPQLEQTVTVHVDVSAGTLADLSDVTFKLWYDSDSSTFAAGEFDAAVANTQTCAVITWNGSVFSLSAGSPTTWSLGSCTAPTLGSTSGDFVLKFTPGKVATATTAGNIWQLAATATSIYGTGFDYDAGGADMNWYGQIILSSASTVDWGVVPLGLDFEDTGASQPVGTVITIISNGYSVLKVKSGATWEGNSNTAILDATGSCVTAQYFALKAAANGALPTGSNGLLNTSGVIIAAYMSSFSESGLSYDSATLWLKLASAFNEDIYTGTITFIVSPS
jgi:parallel beta-helix repeat protein